MKQVCPEVGKRLLDRLSEETESPPKAELTLALGEVRHEPAIPALIELLQDSSFWVRSGAAAALRILRALEAEAALRRALEVEVYVWAVCAIEGALEEITGEPASLDQYDHAPWWAVRALESPSTPSR